MTFYHVITGLPSDIAHDLFEGVVCDVLQSLICHNANSGSDQKWEVLLVLMDTVDAVLSPLLAVGKAAFVHDLVTRFHVLNLQEFCDAILRNIMQNYFELWATCSMLDIKDLLTPFWLFSAMPALITTTNINSIVFGECNSQITPTTVKLYGNFLAAG